MDLFDLFAKITLDTGEYEDGLKDAERKTSKFADTLKNGLATAAKIGAAAIGTAATGISALVKSSVDAYANYEQLVGGVETLFKTSSDKVMEYAANAYETAGMSANEYMETVTSFSASLLQSLDGDTAAAAEKANLAITDMSDNANKMGTSMEMIQNAYNGFAKQNYTMLDNLKLGYGGTKEEMQRLLDDAEKLSGQKFDLSSYGDIVDAIHVVQTEMGITGTTANEASTTISGSFGAAKAAWKNLVTGVANDKADFSKLMDQFVKSAETAAKNILPRVKIAASGIGKFINEALPVVVRKIPEVINDVLPQVFESATNIVTAVGDGIGQNLEPLMDGALNIVGKVGEYISDNASGVIDGVFKFVNKIGDFIAENAGEAADSAVDIITKLGDSLSTNAPKLITDATKTITTLAEKLTTPENLQKIFDTGLSIITSLGGSLISNVGEAVKHIPEIIDNLVKTFTSAENIGSIVDAGETLISSLLDNTDSIIETLGKSVGSIIDGLLTFILGDEDDSESGLYKIIHAGVTLMSKLFEDIPGIMDELDRQLDDIQDRIVEKIENTDWKEVGKKLWELIFEGLKSSAKLTLKFEAKKLGINFDFGKELGKPINGGDETGGAGAGVHRDGSSSSGATIVQNNYFGGHNSLADQEKANQRLAAALAK